MNEGICSHLATRVLVRLATRGSIRPVGAPVHPKGVKIWKVKAVLVIWFYINFFHFTYMFEAALGLILCSFFLNIRLLFYII